MKTKTLIAILIATLILLKPPAINCQETRVIKIMDAQTGSDSITLGNSESPVPSIGYPFTVNITLEGTTSNLFVYQVAIRFDRTKIRCLAAWINRDDPNFVFYNYRNIAVIPNAEINNNEGYVLLGASLINGYSVSVSSGLLCQVNFTAIKTGNSIFQILPSGGNPESFLAYRNDSNLIDISFSSQDFSITLIAFSTPPVASFTFSPTIPKANQDVTFNAMESYDPDGEISYYIWDFADGTNITTYDPIISHTFQSNGIYFVKLTVYDNDNNSSFTLKEVQVGQIPIVKFFLEATLLMPNQSVAFNASESRDPDGYIVSYIWDFGDGTNETTTNPIITHTFLRKGVFWINLTAYDNDGLHNSTIQEIFVGKPPEVNFKYSLQVSNGEYVASFDASQSHAGDSEDYITFYVWDFGDYNITETSSPTIEHIYLERGDYPVKLTIYDNNGLYNSTVKIIKIQETSGIDIKVFIPAGITIFAVIGIVVIMLRRRKFPTFKKKKKGKTL